MANYFFGYCLGVGGCMSSFLFFGAPLPSTAVALLVVSVVGAGVALVKIIND